MATPAKTSQKHAPQKRNMGHVTIGELAKQAGVSTRALRYYEEHGLLVPSTRSEGRYRLYCAATAPKRVQAILALQSLGYTLAEVADMLGKPPAAPLQKAQQLDNTRTRLQAQSNMLQEKLVLLQTVQQEVATKLTILTEICQPCLENSPDTLCQSTCQHHPVHHD